MMMRSRSNFAKLASLVVLLFLVTFSSRTTFAAGGDVPYIEPNKWTFSGFFGYYDQAQLQRGYQVYKEVCAGCHGLKFLSYRNLSEIGFNPEQVKALAAEAEVDDGPNEDGEMFKRPGRPSDRFVSPFKNDQEARAANNGALPPDLSVMAKARSVHNKVSWYLEPVKWVKEIALGYQEGGADYLNALLIGYEEPPKGYEMNEGMNYNKYFKGHQIAMASPLSDEVVEYTDGSPKTVKQYSEDVSAFLMWAADPKLAERKQTGFRVLIYLIVLALILYLAKKKVWSRVKH